MNKLNFDLSWEYTLGSHSYGGNDADWQPVNLPHDAAIERPRSQDAPAGPSGGYAWSGVVTYRKRFDAPTEWDRQTVMVEFEGVYMNAIVTLNGHVVVIHPYGYTGFHADLTPYIQTGAQNELRVVANNSAQPNSRWYTGTGIYRHVWLRTGGAPSIKPWGVFVTTPVASSDESTIAVTTEVAGSKPGAILRATVLDTDGAAIAQIETPITTQRVEQTLTVADAQLWSLDEPNLYTLLSETVVNGAVMDSETTIFGIRSIAIDAQNGFSLNGVPIKLKGGCIHHDHGPLGAASYDRAEERRIEIHKTNGYHAIRCAHNPPAPAMLDACDRLGMLVIDESFDCWRMAKMPNDYHLYFDKHWRDDTASMVRRDRNHPSVIMWSIGNEVAERGGLSDGYSWAQKQADLVRSLDPTRPITSGLPFLFEEVFAPPSDESQTMQEAQNLADTKWLVPTDPETDRWGNLTRPFCAHLDVVGYNYLYARYAWDREHFPVRVIAGTETFPNQAYDYWQATLANPNVIGDFVWTSWDYMGESGIGGVAVGEAYTAHGKDVWPYHIANCGDMDFCGYKRPQSYYRDLLWGLRSQPWIGVIAPDICGQTIRHSEWGWDPVIDSWSFPGDEGKPVQVHVYSIDDEVELLINGVSQGRKPAGPTVANRTVFGVTYQPGTLVAVGYADGVETGRTQLATTGAPAAIAAHADRTLIDAAYGDLAFVTLAIVDTRGNRVMHAKNEIFVDLSGAGELIALGAQDPLSVESYSAKARHAHQGRLLAVVRSNGDPGSIALTAIAQGLAPATIAIAAIG